MNRMRKELVGGILETWAGGLPPKDALEKIFEKVRDIPWGVIGSRDPERVYLKNMGTCSGKHFLFFELATALGFDARHFVRAHGFREFPAELPPHLSKMLEEKDIPDYHNFVKVLVDGLWLTVDVTWPLPLKKHGFPVQESLDDAAVPSDGLEVGEPEKFKEEKIASMPETERERRKLFLQGLSEWVSSLRQ